MEDQPYLRFEAKKGKQITASDLSHPIQKLMSQGGQCYKIQQQMLFLLMYYFSITKDFPMHMGKLGNNSKHKKDLRSSGNKQYSYYSLSCPYNIYNTMITPNSKIK